MPPGKNKQILVVGGSGYIGRNVVRSALLRNYEVTSIGQRDASITGVEYEYIKLDISRREEFKKLPHNKYEYVINLAGYVDHRKFSAGGVNTVNNHLLGLINLMDFLDLRSIKKFIQIGSGEEYGITEAPQKEASREQPTSPYGFSKLAATNFLQMLSRSEGLKVVILRLFLIYGGDQDNNRLIPAVINNCRNNLCFPVTTGEQLRDFCHIDDLIEVIFFTLESNGLNGEIFNIGSGEIFSVREVIEKINLIVGGGDPQFGGLKHRDLENMKSYPCLEKINETGWSAKKQLMSELSELISNNEHDEKS